MLFVDSHVHIYSCYDLEKFFDSAYSNFKNEAIRYGHGDDFTGVLLLAETLKDNWFHHLYNYTDGKKLPDNRKTGNWRFQRTNESCSINARSDNNRSLILIAGRQIVTQEGLELLALVTTKSFKEYNPIKELIETVRGNGAIPVIPWGVGKWTGKRVNALNSMLENVNGSGFFLGDNSGRPIFWPRPLPFKKGERLGIRVLPGSDSLPLANEYHRGGKFGFRISETISLKNPAKDLKQTLMNSIGDFQPYGRLERPLRFFCNQIHLRLRSLISG